MLEEHSHGSILLEKLSLFVEETKKMIPQSLLVLNYDTSTSYENRSSIHQERKCGEVVNGL